MFYFDKVMQTLHSKIVKTRSKSKEHEQTYFNKRRISDRVRNYLADSNTLIEMVGLSLD